jgi:hypothetical protein
MSNSKKKEQPKWLRHPKSQQEKKEFGKAKEEGVPVRGKRKPANLGNLYDDKEIGSNIKKQNKSKKPSRDTIRKGEEDEQSLSKQMKKSGKVTFKGPNVKDRKKFAPATKVETPKKGKGSYNRKNKNDEDEESKSCWKGYVKKGMKKKGDRKVPNCVKESYEENATIHRFVNSVLSKNYSKADDYLKRIVEQKLAKKIKAELNTPLF